MFSKFIKIFTKISQLRTLTVILKLILKLTSKNCCCFIFTFYVYILCNLLFFIFYSLPNTIPQTFYTKMANDNLFSTEDNMNIVNNHNNNTQIAPFVIRVVVLNPPITPLDVIPFVLMFGVYCLIIHTIMMIIKKVHRKTYNVLVMFFIIAFPPITMLILKDYVFITLWIILILFFMYCIKISFTKSLLANKKPKRIYNMFKKIFTVTNIMILLSQLMIVFSRLVYFDTMKFSLRCFVYSVYFAVFCREVMFNLSRVMGQTVGYYSNNKNDTIASNLAENNDCCMICGDKLIKSNVHTKIFTNNCGHSFHMECIKGWALLANNFFCIYCKEKIQDTNKLTKDLWYKTENMMRPVMNMLRSSISFFVVIYLFMMVRLKRS